MEKRNTRKYYLRYVLYYFAYVLITGGIIQSFMLESGISGYQVSVYTAVIQIAQAAAMLLLSPWIEKSKNIIRLNALSQLGLIPAMAAVFLVALYVDMPVPLKYGLMISTGVIANAAFGIIGILEYKLPYRLIDMDNYGEVLSLAGVFSSASSLATSTLFSLCISRFDFFKVVLVFISVGIVMMVLSILVGLSYEDISKQPGISQFMEPAKEVHAEKKTTGIFKYRPFQILCVPNLVRGFASGVFAILTTIGYHYSVINAESASWMVIIANILSVLTCLLYAKLSRYRRDAELILLSTAALFVVFSGILVGKNTVVFLIFYAIGMLFKTIIDYACPVVVTYIVDYDMIGQFTSWRMALYMAGAAVAGVAVIPMLDAIGGEATMIVTGLCFLIAGIGYYFAGKGKGRNE